MATTAIFKSNKFSPKDITGQAKVKQSVARGIRSKLHEQYPDSEAIIEILVPKKAPLVLGKAPSLRLTFVIIDDNIRFFQDRDGLFYPTIRTLHKYPSLLPRYEVDKGAIKHVLAGAKIMCPGLTSAGAKMADGVEAQTVVAIFAEGKEEALAIGKTCMSTDEIRSENKGMGVENVHYLNDGLWGIGEDLSIH
eukprot:TRINITY_DN1894_c0_g1_i1.p1 TRINITY_DN1894_c0_g1~~TRINITY_DN1894_c0_g1_i1.p1  ORF type:complete len:193 (+),score=32.23 TRINITY_DN1894_c0_g1_i1:82-660(+)